MNATVIATSTFFRAWYIINIIASPKSSNLRKREQEIIEVGILGLVHGITNALAIKGQNIGAWTKIFCKQMFDFDILDSNKLINRFLGSFKNHAKN